MSILKLDVGKPLTLAVDEAKEVEGKFGKQMAFHAGDDVLYTSLDTAKRQLDRLGVSSPDGLTFRFEKVAKGGKTFVNIDQATTENRPAKPTPSNPAAQSAVDAYAHPDSPAGKGALPAMLRAHEWALEHIAPLYVKKGIPLSMDALAACAHSLFIHASKR